MSEELLKELSRLQLLRNRYNDKSRMCPLEIKKEETKAKLIFDHIKQLQQENKHLTDLYNQALKDYDEVLKELEELKGDK